MATFKKALTRTLRRRGTGLILISLFVLGLNPRDEPIRKELRHDAKVCIPISANNWCAPQSDPRVKDVVGDLEREGFACSKTPSLTEHLVFQYRDLHIEVVTFDKARELGVNSAGGVQAFCTTMPQ